MKNKSIINVLLIAVIAVNITSCSLDSSKIDVNESGITEDILNEEKLEIQSTQKIVETLCSDEFGGRLVGSEGNEKAEEYILSIVKDLNLEPLFNEYYKPYTQMGLGNDDDVNEKKINNIVGIIKGNDSTKAVVISAHFDHIGYKNGEIIRGALDNASGVAALVKIAQNLKDQSSKNIFSRDIIIAFFNGEETAMQGSNAFVQDIKGKYSNLYNINIDCIGGKEAGKISLKNESKISNKLTDAMKYSFKKNNVEFSEAEVKKGVSDHESFENLGIANICIWQENLKAHVHNPNDNPDALNYEEIDKIAEILCDFINVNYDNNF